MLIFNKKLSVIVEMIFTKIHSGLIISDLINKYGANFVCA